MRLKSALIGKRAKKSPSSEGHLAESESVNPRVFARFPRGQACVRHPVRQQSPDLTDLGWATDRRFDAVSPKVGIVSFDTLLCWFTLSVFVARIPASALPRSICPQRRSARSSATDIIRVAALLAVVSQRTNLAARPRFDGWAR